MTKRKKIIFKIIGGILIAFSLLRCLVWFASIGELYPYYGLGGAILHSWPDFLIFLVVATIGGILWDKGKKKKEFIDA